MPPRAMPDVDAIPASARLVILGAPLDENSSFLNGPAQGPAALRAALHSGSANLCTEAGLDLGSSAEWHDAGDLRLTTGDAALEEIRGAIGALLEQRRRVLTIGGDHSISWPILRAFADHHRQLTVLHIDAHADLYDDFEGNPRSHASPFARVMESCRGVRLVQVGIRTLTPHQRAQARRFGVDIVEMRDWREGMDLRLEGPLYVSLDMDALDPAFAPGVSHHEPGGFTVREVLGILRRLPGPVVGADIVELNPTRDSHGRTAMVAAKFLKELAGVLLAAPPT
jgi:arginase